MLYLRIASLLVCTFHFGSTTLRAEVPEVTSFFPAGVTRGQTVRVQAEGNFKPWPVKVRVLGDGIEFLPEEESGYFTVTASPDAAPGVRWIRLYNGDGAASLWPFVVGTVPDMVEAEPNNANDQAQAIDPSAVVINGRLQKAGDIDCFAVPLEAGQTLVAALDANRSLGSPMDGILQIVSPEGFVVDHADDSPRLDPGLAFTAPSTGIYFVRAFAFPAEPDSSIRFAGGDNYVYRLTLTTRGYVEMAFPPAVSTDEVAPRLIPIGWNLGDDPEPLEIKAEAEAEHSTVGWREGLAGYAQVGLVDLPLILERDGDPEPVPAPSMICGLIAADGESDSFTLQAEAGQAIRVEVAARSLGSPLDPVLLIEDAAGKQLAKADDSRRKPDPEASVTVPQDGLIRIILRDLHGRGGPRYLYRIEVREFAPDFALTVDTDHVEVGPEKPQEISLSIDRGDGFDHEISFEAQGLPEGVVLEAPASEPKGDSSKKVTLRLIATMASPWSGPFRLIGKTGKDHAHRSATSDRIGGPPIDELWLTVVPVESINP